MNSEKKFGLLRNILRALGLSQEAADDIVNWIVDLLAGDGKNVQTSSPQFPYHLRQHFLTPAELDFFCVLLTIVNNRAALCTKVGLSDIFQVKIDEQSRYRIYTNKIDRKHVDFLLCDPATMRPIMGIELDDKSHQRPDRRERDAFVDQVFAAAKLPLLHIPVKRTYNTAELTAQIAPYLGVTPILETVAPVIAENQTPKCPKCGSEMLLRTAKTGANAGNQFWGCANYPTCRSMLPVTN
jgi:hypothetical protein